MLAGEYYDQALANQMQTAQEQTGIINEIKIALDHSEAEQIKALEDGFDKLSKAVGNIAIPTANGQKTSQNSAIMIQIISYSYPQMTYWYDRWWYWNGYEWV